MTTVTAMMLGILLNLGAYANPPPCDAIDGTGPASVVFTTERASIHRYRCVPFHPFPGCGDATYFAIDYTISNDGEQLSDKPFCN